jgi:Ribonucleotide reductase, barrel domain
MLHARSLPFASIADMHVASLQDIQFDEATEAMLCEEYDFDMRGVYKTVWEIKQKHLVEMAADRGAFIDQSQSFNVHIGDPNFGKLTSLHFTAWRLGLKTGMYYLRTRAAADAIKFTVWKALRYGCVVLSNSARALGMFPPCQPWHVLRFASAVTRLLQTHLVLDSGEQWQQSEALTFAAQDP